MNLIDPKESVFLGFALSLDNFGIGISSSLIGSSYILFPILISVFQFMFLRVGILIGKKVCCFIGFSDFACSMLSGFYLFLLAYGNCFLFLKFCLKLFVLLYFYNFFDILII